MSVGDLNVNDLESLTKKVDELEIALASARNEIAIAKQEVEATHTRLTNRIKIADLEFLEANPKVLKFYTGMS